MEEKNQNPVELSENDDINYQINTSTTKQQETGLQNINTKETDKANIIQALHKEMILNEELRTYISILKESIESQLYKTGFAALIKQSKEFNEYPSEDLVDFFVDFNKFKQESEKYRKELNAAKNVIKDVKEKNLNLKKDFEDVTAENILLKEKVKHIENKGDGMEKDLQKRASIIEQKGDECSQLQKNNDSLKHEVLQLEALSNNQNTRLKEAYNQINDMQNTINNLVETEKKLDSALNVNESLKREILRQKNVIDGQSEEIEVIKAENANLIQKLNLLQQRYNETAECQTKKDAYYSENISGYVDQINNLKQALEDITGNYNIVQDEHSDLKIQNEKLKKDLSLLSVDYSTQKREIVSVKSDNDCLVKKLKDMDEAHNELLMQNMENQKAIGEVTTTNAKLESESRYWKEQFESTLEKSDRIITKLKGEYETLNQKNTEDEEKIEKLKKLNTDLSNKLTDKCDNEQRLILQRDNYQKMTMNLNKKIEEHNKTIQESEDEKNALKEEIENLHGEIESLKENEKELQETKMKLIDEINRASNEHKTAFRSVVSSISRITNSANRNNIGKDFQKRISQISNIEDPKEQIDQFVSAVTNEVFDLNKNLSDAKEEIKQTNIKYFDSESRNRTNTEQNIELTEANAKSTENIKALENDIDSLRQQVRMLSQTCDNYSTELQGKNNLLAAMNYNISTQSDQLLKIKHDKEYIEVILLRLCKMFPNSNLYALTAEMFNEERNINEREEINHKILIELKRIEDYIRLVKENSLEAEYVNKQLTRQFEALRGSSTTLISTPPQSNYSY